MGILLTYRHSHILSTQNCDLRPQETSKLEIPVGFLAIAPVPEGNTLEAPWHPLSGAVAVAKLMGTAANPLAVRYTKGNQSLHISRLHLLPSIVELGQHPKNLHHH